MKTRKKSHFSTNIPKQEYQNNATKHRLTVHSKLSPLLSELQGLNLPADQVQANWMASGKILGFRVTPPKMVLQVQPSKPIPEDIYEYWTSNPLLQIQLFSAYMCHSIVDIFSIAPDEPTIHPPKNGGEILTINVEQGQEPT